MSSNLVKGTAILTMGLFLSKALGLLYLFLFMQLLGKKISDYINMHIFLTILHWQSPFQEHH